MVGQFALLLAIASLGLAERQHFGSRLGSAGGWTLVAAAAACGLAGTLTLGRHLTPFPKPSADTPLVQHGIYRLVRHPLYTAVVSAAVGWSLLRSSGPALLTSLVLAVFLDAKARHEERWLRRQFPEYAAYQQRVRRFVPWVY